MTKLTLPRLNQVGANEWGDVEANDVAIRELVNGGLDNENIAPGANIARTKLEAGAQGIPGLTYPALYIATEQTRENTVAGTMATPDEIPITVPENALVSVTFEAWVKGSGSGAIVWLYCDSTIVASSETLGTSAHIVNTGSEFTTNLLRTTSLVANTVPRFLPPLQMSGLTPGTHSISVRYSAGTGNVAAKERKLRISVTTF
jgi:hypothetical protein